MSNSSTISTDSIYSQIYGNAATNNMASVVGGSKIVKRPSKYMAKIMDKIESSTSISGGSGVKTTLKFDLQSQIAVDPYNYLTKRSALTQKWITTTRLLPAITSAERNSIIVLPPEHEMNGQIDQVESGLRSAKIDLMSSDASEFVATHPFKFMNYYLNYRPNGDNKGYQYEVPTTFPSRAVIRRVGRSKGVYYMKFNDENNILVSNNDSFTNPSKLKFVAKANNGVCILNGFMPEPTEFENRSATTIVGGSKSKDNYRNYFERLINYRNGDISKASYDFIGALGAAGIPVSDLAKHYSSSYIHSAFENMFSLENAIDNDKNGPYAILRSIYDNNKIDGIHEAIQKVYKPRKNRLSIERAKSAIKDIYSSTIHCAKNGRDANTKFINGLAQVYENLNEPSSFKADVATAVVKSQDGIGGFQDACNLVDSMDSCKNENSIFNTEFISGGSKKGVSTPLINTLYGLMYSSPFIGVICKENVPLPVNFRYSGDKVMNGRYDLLQGGECTCERDEGHVENPIIDIHGAENGDVKVAVQTQDQVNTVQAKTSKCPKCGSTPCICAENTIEVFV